MKIRGANESDAESAYDLICELKGTKYDFDNFKMIFKNKLKNDRARYMVAEENKKLVGLLGLNIDYQLHHPKKVATVEELIITEDCRGKGVGKKLIEEVIKNARENDCDVIELTSNFARERAHNFYMKNGFSKDSYKFMMKL